jgi:hypothetical protein
MYIIAYIMDWFNYLSVLVVPWRGPFSASGRFRASSALEMVTRGLLNSIFWPMSLVQENTATIATARGRLAKTKYIFYNEIYAIRIL